MRQKTFEVDICESYKKTVTVKATNRDEAHEKAQALWKDGAFDGHAEERTEVDFFLCERKKERSPER